STFIPNPDRKVLSKSCGWSDKYFNGKPNSNPVFVFFNGYITVSIKLTQSVIFNIFKLKNFFMINL
ncbi:hypothetical protein EQY69_14690, partial [Clostridium perfringens]|nr:hypothetical protein [Clostridium perfringens]